MKPESASPQNAPSLEEDRRQTERALQAAVRQRQAEVAALTGAGYADNAATELLAAAWIGEPSGVSYFKGLGRPLTLVRKVFFHLFLKTYLRPLMNQVGSFQQLAAQRLAASQERERDLLRKLQELEGEVAALRREAHPPENRRPLGDS